ncbi:hydantoinase/oxoprolinase family protein [Corynebacterium glyciniphilum]|uniref:5-oxoprolinase (ATP-hydrolyzing) n=1 Tax=Corynebacterium glyciniphilum AJ 3170 TaxID=1404245 RepID=X5EDB9_9CORY|nr:hydantoinase/oxoprolinase family protein [Corynebacterium glyciniphilum]AHW64621.1 5-oxoprolinase (ATP-hydrolyzing) [Corynebacterium glyciniphilum AJ 3170]
MTSTIEPGVRTAVDIGGTFTDVYVQQADGTIITAKYPTQADPIDGVLKGMALTGVEWKDVDLFSHGTTIATNALITRNFPKVAMVTTEGFRDVIEIRRGDREDWDPYNEVAAPFVPRRHRLTVSERVGYDGEVLTALDEDGAREVARVLRRRGVETVAVCFVNAYTNPVNEERMAEILAEELPGVPVCTSSDVLPEIFEYERFNTTVANAALVPIIGPYAKTLESRLTDAGYDNDVLLLHSGGGVMTPKMAETYGARLAASGIAAGAIASRHIGRKCGFENSIGFDMGGTSTDVSLTENGVLGTTDTWSVQFGFPICFPSIEVLTIGAGGGSIAWLDDAKSLRSGPQSAGSTPGPACYGDGGELATNTDANLVLGTVGVSLAGGVKQLDVEKAREAISGIAEPLGLGIEEAAQSIIKVANANMADAIRLISVRKGHDPRDFALVGFGGAGPLHVAYLAKDLGIPTVIVPPHPGVTSATGCLLVDIQHDLTKMYLTNAEDADLDELNTSFAELAAEGRDRLTAEHVEDDDMVFQYSIDMRYQGQWRSISVDVGVPITSLDEVIDKFHETHLKEHNFSNRDTGVEIYRLQVKAIGLTAHADEQPAELIDPSTFTPTAVEVRQVLFPDETARVETPIYNRTDLPAGAVIDGPCIIDQLDTTTVVPPQTTARVDEWDHLILTTAP